MPLYLPPYDATLFHPGFISGRFYSTFNGAHSTVAAIPAIDTLYVSPFVLASPITIQSLYIRVNTGGASSNIKLAIWGNNSVSGSTGYGRATGAPLAAVDTGQATTAPGVVGASVTPVTLPPGVYWCGWKSDGTPCTPTTIAQTDHTVNSLTGRSGVGAATTVGCLSTASSFAASMPTLTGGETWADVAGAGVILFMGT